MGGDAKPIQISLRGDDLARLAPLGERLLGDGRARCPARRTWTPARKSRGRKCASALNRKAAGDLGLDLGTVASTVRGLVAGEVVSQFEDPDGDSYDVRLRVDASRAHAAAATCWSSTCPAQGGRALVPAEPGGLARDRRGALQDPPPRPDARNPHQRQHRRAARSAR